MGASKDLLCYRVCCSVLQSVAEGVAVCVAMRLGAFGGFKATGKYIHVHTCKYV